MTSTNALMQKARRRNYEAVGQNPTIQARILELIKEGREDRDLKVLPPECVTCQRN
jgi:hypothetical protein